MKLRISKKDIEKAKDVIRIIKDKNSCYKIQIAIDIFLEEGAVTSNR